MCDGQAMKVKTCRARCLFEVEYIYSILFSAKKINKYFSIFKHTGCLYKIKNKKKEKLKLFKFILKDFL